MGAVRTSHMVAMSDQRIETGYVQHLHHIHRYSAALSRTVILHFFNYLSLSWSFSRNIIDHAWKVEHTTQIERSKHEYTTFLHRSPSACSRPKKGKALRRRGQEPTIHSPK
jgi:hypothetical protein